MRPVINPIYPIADVDSIDELMAIAVGMEHEAAERYLQLAGMMEKRGDGEMTALFRQLAELEREHEQGLGRWAEREGRKAPLPAAFAWSMPETFDDDDVRALTPYRALGVAVRNEERAFAFYTYLSAIALDEKVRAYAEALAREELNHVGQLRRLRRRAFHMERAPPRSARRVDTVEGLQSLAESLEAASAEVVDVAATAVERSGLPGMADALRKVKPSSRRREGLGSNAAEGARAAGLLEPGALTADGALGLAMRDADEVADAYMAIAEQANDETVVGLAQSMAERAVGRAVLVRALWDERIRRDGA